MTFIMRGNNNFEMADTRGSGVKILDGSDVDQIEYVFPADKKRSGRREAGGWGGRVTAGSQLRVSSPPTLKVGLDLPGRSYLGRNK